MEGLKGILPIREDKFIRPLIDSSRDQIIEYLNNRGIAYRKDSSNESRQFLRNKVRKDLIPFLKKEFNPRIEEKLAQTAQILRHEDNFIKRFVAEAMQSPFVSRINGGFSLNVDYLLSLHPAIRYRLFKYLLESLIPEDQVISFIHLNAVEKLIFVNKTGKSIYLPRLIAVRQEYDCLILEKRELYPKEFKYEYPLSIDGSFHIKEKNVTICLQRVTKDYIDYKNRKKVYMDLDTLRPPLFLRNRRNGDWLEPMGMGGRKKIKDYFIDRKIPRAQRDKIMLLADAVSVVWIEEMCLSERVKITDKTKNVLEIKLIKSEKHDV